MKYLSLLLGFIRLFLFALSASIVYFYLVISNWFITDRDKKMMRGIRLRRTIIRNTHFILGSKIISYGKIPNENGLIVSNHRTYFDSMVILKNILSYPIAKKEVASWPLIGSVCKSTGVLFVDREKKSERPVLIENIRQILLNGYSILNTPEGTTHTNPTTIAFKPGAFFIAAELNKPVIPIAIDYKNMGDAWVGDDTFLPHFIRCFGKWKTEIKVAYLDPIYSDNAEELVEKSRFAIDQEMLRFRADWNSN